MQVTKVAALPQENVDRPTFLREVSCKKWVFGFSATLNASNKRILLRAIRRGSRPNSHFAPTDIVGVRHPGVNLGS